MPNTEHASTEPHAETAMPPLADVAETRRECITFIREVVADSGAEGVVVNLSGGIDSTVSATLATEALGSDSLSGLVLPAAATPTADVDDARQIAEELVIDYRVVDIQPLVDRFTSSVTGGTRRTPASRTGRPQGVTVDATESREHDRAAMGNATARLRMLIAYFRANTTNHLVLGTGNRTELLLGYFTKYGDGGVDLLPIGDWYKTHVRQVARALDVSEEVIAKQPTAGLWEGQTDEDELGASYERIDAILYHVIDEGRSIEETADALGVADGLVRRFTELSEATAHKRRMPPTPATRTAAPAASDRPPGETDA